MWTTSDGTFALFIEVSDKFNTKYNFSYTVGMSDWLAAISQLVPLNT